jgi:hypothetical protein
VMDAPVAVATRGGDDSPTPGGGGRRPLPLLPWCWSNNGEAFPLLAATKEESNSR